MMKTRKNMLRLISCLLALFATLYSFSQKTAPDKQGKLPVNVLEEKIILTADRNFYIVEENIQFNACYLTSRDLGNTSWSTVLYVELIHPDGTPEMKSKFPLTNEGASGVLQIPKHLPGGNYYLKAYTKWMRNYSPEGYAYYQIKLINPYDPNLAASHSNGTINELHHAKIKTVDGGVEISTDKQKYGTREKVNVLLECENSEEETGFFISENTSTETYIYSVSVVKSGLKFSSLVKSEWKHTLPKNTTANYYPEIDGISLTGKVVDPLSRQAVTDANVSLSLLDNQSFYSEIRTTEEGVFFFTVPYSQGEHDFFINAEKNRQDLEIQIDNDFCKNPLSIERLDFQLTPQEETLADELAVNTQIRGKYLAYGKQEESSNKEVPKLSFYGVPDKVYFTEKYIDLPNVKEFLFEIIPEVTVSYHENMPSIHASSKNAYHYYPFLILIDNIPVTDLKTFLNIKTNTIERFDLVDKSYVLGNAKFNGILNAYSKNQDMAGIELPKNSLFFSYELFSPLENRGSDRLMHPRQPDRRNCLYWNPDFKLKSGEEAEISFYTSDIPGDYEIIIQRISKAEGEVTFLKKQFSVE